MNHSRAPLFWGLLLIALGVLLLLGSAGFAAYAGLWWGIVLLGAAVLCVVSYARRPERWGVLFGVTLLGVAGAVSVADTVLPGTASAWSGPAFMVALGLPFAAGFAVSGRWGLLIPAGLFGAVAVAALVRGTGLETVAGAIFLFALAATFAILPYAGAPVGARRWAFPLSLVLAILGVLTLLSSVAAAGLSWALLLILAGVFLLYRGARPRPSGT